MTRHERKLLLEYFLSAKGWSPYRYDSRSFGSRMGTRLTKLQSRTDITEFEFLLSMINEFNAFFVVIMIL